MDGNQCTCCGVDIKEGEMVCQDTVKEMCGGCDDADCEGGCSE